MAYSQPIHESHKHKNRENSLATLEHLLDELAEQEEIADPNSTEESYVARLRAVLE